MATSTPRARIGRISGPFLSPTVSRNKRQYTKENIANAVATMRARIADPNGKPITMLTHHAAGDKSTEIAARVTGVSFDPQTGTASYEADIADTAAGRDVLALATPGADGKRYLQGVSIRGWWNGPVESKVVDGQQVETADDLEVDGIDFTKNPGVDEAGITKVLYEHAEMAAEGRAKVIVETVDSASVVEEAPAEEAEKPKPETPGGDYADPGYQKDKKPRYPCDSKAHAVSAWAYISKQSNADKYTGAQLKRIKGKIKAALKRFGVHVADESFDLEAAVCEAHVEEASVHMGIDHGQGSVHVSGSTGWDKGAADLHGMATKVARAAMAAHILLDPDGDGVVDDEDPDDMDEPRLSSPAESHNAGTPGLNEQEPEMATESKADEATTPTTESAPAAGAEETFTKAQLDEAVKAAVAEAAAAKPADEQVKPTAETVTAESMKAMLEEIAQAKTDALRESILAEYGPPRRKGLARIEEKAPEKPLHEMTSEELRRFSTEVFDAAFPAVR